MPTRILRVMEFDVEQLFCELVKFSVREKNWRRASPELSETQRREWVFVGEILAETVKLVLADVV